MKDIDRHGIAVVMKRALALAGKDTLGIHVSFDLDVCDPAIAPGVGTPVKGGLDYREAHMVMEMIADSGRLMALDLVEINPILDIAESDGDSRHGAGAVGAGNADYLMQDQLRRSKSEVRSTDRCAPNFSSAPSSKLTRIRLEGR